MKGDRRQSGHLMLISPQRVFYAGLLGRPRDRTSGGFNVYCAVEGQLTVTRAGRSDGPVSLAVVPAYVQHSVESDHPTIISVVIEPETVQPGALEVLAARLSGADGSCIGERIRAVYDELRRGLRTAQMSTRQFDELLFGSALPARELEPRVAVAVTGLVENPERPVTAEDCASEAGLSQSRFLHLFKDETGVSFRAFRAWKRARHLLHFVNETINFAHLAQDIGYPDSTHFSHSIRRFYGLKPRAIFTGSRDLAIYRNETHPEREAIGA